MFNESERWLKTLIVVLAILIMVGLVIKQEQRIAELKAGTETTNIVVNEDLLFADPYIPPESITFGDNVGKLIWEDGIMRFEGDAEESAKIFFDYFLVMYIDEYIENEIKMRMQIPETFDMPVGEVNGK